MTRDAIIREFHRLCEIVNFAECNEFVSEQGARVVGLLDADDAQRMRDSYRERADLVLRALERESKLAARS